MNYRNNMGRSHLSLLLMTLGTSFSLGCSDVSFAPGPLTDQEANSGKVIDEFFTQGFVNNKLDILFVVDNSWSMAEEQQKMGVRISSFLSTLYDVDWQIGITTTDVSSGKYGLQGDLLNIAGTSSNALTRLTPNFEEKFNDTVVRAESIACDKDCPSGLEQPLKAALLAIGKRNTTNEGFFRDGADLGVLVLSDADEMSSGGQDELDPALPPTNIEGITTPIQLLNTFKSIWTDSKNLYAFGMIVQPGDTNCLNQQRLQDNGEGYYGNYVQNLANLTGGLTGSICQNDYGPTLGQIAEKVRTLVDYVQLKFIPTADSVYVQFDPSFDTTWSLQGRRIYFDTPPPKGTKISVEYVVK